VHPKEEHTGGSKGSSAHGASTRPERAADKGIASTAQWLNLYGCFPLGSGLDERCQADLRANTKQPSLPPFRTCAYNKAPALNRNHTPKGRTCLSARSDNDGGTHSRDPHARLLNDYRFFFLCRFLRRRFLRLWVAILWRLRFFPQGIAECLFMYVLK